MRRLATVVALACLLSGSVLAGEVPTVGNPAPPPSPITNSTASPGEIPSDASAMQIPDAAVSGLLSVIGWLSV